MVESHLGVIKGSDGDSPTRFESCSKTENESEELRVWKS
jgi:hypothetical protein